MSLLIRRLCKKSGAWFSYGDTRLGQGRENVREFLRQNPTLTQEIELLTREKLNLPGLIRQDASDEAAQKA